MRNLPRFFAALTSVLFATACSPPNPGADAADGSDARAESGLDASTDVASPDAMADVAPPIDAQACNGPELEDLNALGTVADGVLSYSGSNEGTSDVLEEALQPDVARCGFRAIHQRLFRYTLQSAGALRVSTNNRGTETTFDSALFMARLPCFLPPAILGCNDDDPTGPRFPHVQASLAFTSGLPAGTSVLISLSGFYPAAEGSRNEAGEVGNFELTVREIPSVSIGMPCDVQAQMNVCDSGSACINDGSGNGICRADGTVPGAICSAGSLCVAPLGCDGQINRCYESAAIGQPCDAVNNSLHRCVADTTCVPLIRGTTRGTCRANGSVALAACAAESTCSGAGLVCRSRPGQGPLCLREIAPGGACNTVDTICVVGESCVQLGPGAAVGTCMANGSVRGTECRSDATECDGDLFCIAGGSDRTCRTVGTTRGAACGNFGVCSFDDVCIALEPTSPTQGGCTPLGTQSSACRPTGTACDPGLVCTMPTARDRGRCLQAAAIDGACDPAGRRFLCPSNSTCVREGTSGSDGSCRSNGTRAGTACRTTGTRCDAGAMCTTTTGAGLCQRDPIGDACDPRFNTVRCPAGQFCRASALDSGTCAVAATETEPNNELTTSGPTLISPATVRATLGASDIDCYGITVAAGGSVFAQLASTSGACGAQIALDLFAPDGSLIGSDAQSGPFQCPRIDGRDAALSAWARTLPAGRYNLCVRGQATGYVLSL